MKRLLKILLWVILIIIGVPVLFVAYISFVDYQPADVEVISVSDKTSPVLDTAHPYYAVSWNLGYGGLGANMDFFYDGGQRVRDTRENTTNNLQQLISFMEARDTIDFWLLQEVDVNSKRSYHINEKKLIESSLPDYQSVFAINYKVPYVPVPLSEPMGKVVAGMMTLSATAPQQASRIAYPLIASWPDRLFLLDRCFVVTRYPVCNGKELVVLNTHNSAYVYDSLLREQELMILKSYALREYERGNYVVAGGDWNQNPPHYQPDSAYGGHRFMPSVVQMSVAPLEQWEWAWDGSTPTNRNNDQAYITGVVGTTALDYFLVSPNVRILSVRVKDLQFENTDHQPVFLRFALDQ